MSCSRGSILVLVLFVMTVLSLAAVSFAYRAALESRSVRARVALAQLRARAMSAAYVALARLKENVNDFDHRAEPWHTHPPFDAEEWLPEGPASRSDPSSAFVTEYHVIDEESKLHPLFASSEALRKLGMSPSQIASLLDWADQDEFAEAEGAETEYYLALAQPYRCKNGPLELLDELLLVRGFRLRDYLGEDANHNGILDPSENDGGLSYPLDDADGELRLGWVDLLTCFGNGLINLNTAPRPVLATLPISDRATDQILGYRAFDENSAGKFEDHVFRSASDIDQLQGLTEADRDVLKQVARFRSEHFRVFAHSRHVPTGLTYRLQVVVKTTGDRLQVLQWKVGM